MNNKKILVVGVLAVIVTMMVGYALFSETITINGTATAKGSFEITESCRAGVSNDILTAMGATESDLGEGGYSNDTCTVNGNSVSYSANFKYPGAKRYFTITLKNTGSITAVVVNDTSETKVCLDENDDDIAENCQTLQNSLQAGVYTGPVAFIKEDGTIILDGSDEADEFYNTPYDMFALKPGQTAVLLGSLSWDDKLDSEAYNNQLFKVENTFTLYFEQYND